MNPGDVVRIEDNLIGVSILAPSMAAGNGPWWFTRNEISASREDWP